MDNGEDENELLCGALFPVLGTSNLDEEIERSNKSGIRFSLSEKAKWSFQMASAVAHTHLTAHTFHMDIKPSNLVITEGNRDLVLIDWEQSGAPLCTLAPEADGTWDVEESEKSSLVYKKYTGPHRENLPSGRPKWNIFPIWSKTHPRALEAVEVFSLGCTMGMMMQQMSEDEFENLQDEAADTDWNQGNMLAGDTIPERWKGLVKKCVDYNPNKRPRLQELVAF